MLSCVTRSSLNQGRKRERKGKKERKRERERKPYEAGYNRKHNCKRNINKQIAKHVEESGTKRPCLVVDGPSARSTKELINIGIEPKLIFPVTNNKHDFKHMTEVLKGKIPTSNMLCANVWDMFSNIGGKFPYNDDFIFDPHYGRETKSWDGMSLIYFDVTNGLPSPENPKFNMILNVFEILCKKKYLVKHTILAMTFCLNAHRNNPLYIKDKHEVCNIISNILNNNDMSFQILSCKKYVNNRAPMASVVYKIG